MSPKIVFDRKNCEGFFVCTAQDPDNFVQPPSENKADLEGGTEVRPGLWEKEIDGDALDAAVDAAAGCPVDVIKIVDDDDVLLEGPERLPVEEELAEGESPAAR